MSRKEQHIALDWFRGTKGEAEKEQRKTVIYSGISALAVLRDVLKNRLDMVRREQKADFDNPAWPYKQAKLLGKEEAIEELMQLLPRPDND